MKDQAENLRRQLIREAETRINSKTLAVISGKGGVGKTNFTLNFALALAAKGHSVLVMDMDIGMGNLDILLGSSSRFNITDFFRKNVPLSEVISSGPEGLDYITGGSALGSLMKLSSGDLNRFEEQFTSLIARYDYIFLDMGAGISEDSIRFILAVNEIIVIVTPEPTSIMDAYSAIKYINIQDCDIPVSLAINRSHSDAEGRSIYARLNNALEKFLGKSAGLLGIIPDDKKIQEAVIKQVPFLLYSRTSPASRAVNSIAEGYTGKTSGRAANPASQFVSKLKQLFLLRQ
ncbi:MinD/ParA family protein [Bacillus sp. OG2]|uniref:MinD/ParA family protein n=1 Tax=Bacillus infantis TaxID=324767 RepID=UPI000B9B477C|nr:cobyrinic acid a,c-diamide synthase [Bacillus sp. OG2]